MKIQKMLRLRGGKRLKDILQLLGKPVAQRLHALLARRVLLAPHRLEGGKSEIRLPHGVPPDGSRRLQPLHGLGHGREGSAVGRLHLGAFGHFSDSAAQPAAPECRPLGKVLQKKLPEGRLLHGVGHRLPEAAGILQPLQRVCLALQLVIQLQHQRCEAAVVPSGAQGLG